MVALWLSGMAIAASMLKGDEEAPVSLKCVHHSAASLSTQVVNIISTSYFQILCRTKNETTQLAVALGTVQNRYARRQ